MVGEPGACGALLGLMGRRRSVREFEARAVPAAVVGRLLSAFDSAPQAGGDRGRRCLMLTDPGLIAGLAASGREAYRDWLSSIDSPAVRDGLADYGSNFFWFDAAPVLALSVIRRPPAFLMEAAGPEAELVWGGHLSAAMAIEAALLAAVALGLGGCCLGGPLAVGPEMGRFLGLGRRERLSLMAVFGYPKIVPG